MPSCRARDEPKHKSRLATVLKGRQPKASSKRTVQRLNEEDKGEDSDVQESDGAQVDGTGARAFR